MNAATQQPADERLAEIRDLAAELFDADPAAVESARSFVDDLEADSLLAIEMVTQLEKRYGVLISEEAIPRMVNLKATFEVVAEIAGW
ncbi:acyl carrier protein [Streptomyces sp. NPDC056528]|uniref:acyl carrier protein n=1 Tax=Streptomyces sp. NPDC056528 TaxID=3345854 RepID=UPI0036CD8774